MATYRIAALVALSFVVAVHAATTTKDADCSSSEVTKQLATCLQGFTGALAGGDVCGAWSTFECCVTNHFSSCDDATKQSVANKVAAQKSTFGMINPNLKSCTATCAVGGSTPVTPPSATTAKDADCSASDVTKQLTTCLQGFTGALAGGNSDVCGLWSTFECCMANSFSSCDAATKKSVADKVAVQKSTFGTINPNLKSCTANCAGSTPVSNAAGSKFSIVLVAVLILLGAAL